MFFRKENINLNQRIGSTIPLSGQPGNFDFMIYVTCYPYKVVRDKDCHQQTNTHHEKKCQVCPTHWILYKFCGENDILAEQTEARHLVFPNATQILVIGSGL